MLIKMSNFGTKDDFVKDSTTILNLSFSIVNNYRFLCAGLDSNQRCPKAGDLQSPGIATIRPARFQRLRNNKLKISFIQANTCTRCHLVQNLAFSLKTGILCLNKVQRKEN